jgi:hypothetical protein
MKYFALSLLLFISVAAFGQTVVKGTVTDARTKKPIQFVSVAFNGSTTGTITGADGKYTLRTSQPYTQLKITFIGYKQVFRTVVPNKLQEINFQLEEEEKTLSEVTIKSGKRVRYRNKDNPAVELIRKVIENKDKNRVQSYDYAEYEKYEKLQFSLTNLSSSISDRKIFRRYKFLLDNRDSTTLPGKSLLPVYLDEKISQTYYRKNPDATKTILKGEKKVDFGDLFDSDGTNELLNRMYSEVNIYDNNIYLMTNEFLSPIADVAPNFYKFFITDTITDNNVKLVELSFIPRYSTDMLFQGEIYITLDGNYAVQKAKLSINKDINLNWVRDMYVNQDFERNPDGRYMLMKSETKADFGISKKGKTGVFGERVISYRNYILNNPRPDTTYRGQATVMVDDAREKDAKFWMSSRGTDTLTKAESKVYHNIDTLQTIPAFRRTVDIATLLIAGYKSFGPFEVGPANTFYSYNPVEGLRLRVGGRTTPELSKRYYFETYGAYGFNDHQWKYFLSSTYSINNKSIYKFPQNYVRASVQRDTKIPGADLQFIQEDNILLSFKRGVNDKYLYNDYYKLDYIHEYENHFSYELGFRSWKQSPAGSLYFEKQVNDQLVDVGSLTTSEVSLKLRIAPKEKLLQGKVYRYVIPSPNPIFNINYTVGIKGLVGGQYSYQNLQVHAEKRFLLSQLGYTDVSVDGGYIFGQAPFPLLNIHRANQTYSYQPDSYNLMNFLEFVSDHSASINIDHCFNGFFFNKIPLLRKLKWRECVTFKAIYGGVRDENNPALQRALFQYPVDVSGPITYALNGAPYTEGSVGISNILKFFRVDLVERFNYLDHPNTIRYGIRTRAVFDF